MHTFDWEDDRPHKELDAIKCPDDDQMVYIHHNGDYSGDAIVNVPVTVWDQIIVSSEMSPSSGGQRVEFKLPAKLLADFSRNATVHEVIGVIEDMM